MKLEINVTLVKKMEELRKELLTTTNETKVRIC